jgi:hypothetical protein
MGGDDYVIDENGAWASMAEALEWYRQALTNAQVLEREACAKICDDLRDHKDFPQGWGPIAEACATAIRSRMTPNDKVSRIPGEDKL